MFSCTRTSTGTYPNKRIERSYKVFGFTYFTKTEQF